MTNIITLTDLAHTAAGCWDECDHALTALNGTYGAPYDAARTNLTKDLVIAESEGLDLSVFSGKESPFRFEDLKVNIAVRVYRKPSEHPRLAAIDAKIEKAEQDLKILKSKRKALIEELEIRNQINQQTDKIVTAFSRMKS